MPTIDQLEMRVYYEYARRTEYIEQINKQFHLGEAKTIPPQTLVTDLMPKLSELDLLLGVTKSYAPWALFYPPKKFNLRRKSPFTFSRVMPTLGSEEEEEDDMAMLENVATKSPEEKKEQEILKKAMKQIQTINEWLSHIVGRIGQLLQG